MTSDLASARYRVLIPAEQLARRGHEVQVASLPAQGWPAEVLTMRVDVLVISKSFHLANEELAAAHRSRGTHVVVDLCDDHLTHPEIGAHHRRLIALSHQVTASTEMMANAVRSAVSRDSIVVSDPVEGPRGEPAFAPQFPALRVIWFGHPSNLDSLAAKAGDLAALAGQLPVKLTVVTTVSEQTSLAVSAMFSGAASRLHITLVEWSQVATWKALADCDLVWIPALDNERKAAKSPNRLLEALWAGRMVVADAVPAYQPFAEFTPIGRPLVASVREALDETRIVQSRINLAQRCIARNHSAYSCGSAWAVALGDPGTNILRLNLGCGDKILRGYVNVDIAASRAGSMPDVICDLRDLAPFADNSADEILSVHVVEHFWRWEVAAVLREWLRVLKPGATMVLECPNLLSACQSFIQEPDRLARMDANGQRTMWVLYGDPAWQDPLMVHRWGYTPESLKALLAEVGLVDIRQEPAQFKLREPRDMRIVGNKRNSPC